MCGIAGIHGRPASRGDLDGMLDRLEHRGPDQVGRFVDETVPVAMGARRLAIVDPEGGSQPVRNEDGSVVAVFNGEIYNHRALREDLEARGHSFATDCDTEVLVHLWEEYGPGLTERLDGMFAVAIWDGNAERLFLVRDRLGVKPLYVATEDNGVVWGSEIPALLAAGVDRAVDEAAVYEYFSLQYTPGPRTLFERIEKLPPGTSLLVEDGEIDRRRYWRFAPEPHDPGRSDAVRRTRELLEDAVQSRLMADVPVGAFLSGGLDSTAVVGLMDDATPDPVPTFSVGFQSEAYDESEEARFAAREFGCAHSELTVDLSSMDVFGDVVRRFGEPLADPAALPTAMLASHASQDVKTVLTGEGADELFAGYDHFRRLPRDRRRLGWLPDAVFDLAATAERVVPVGAKYLRYLASLRSDEDAILSWVRGYGTLPEVYLDTEATPASSGLRDRVPSSWPATARTTLQRLSAFYVQYWLPDDLLYKVDHATMAASLEARVPYLDHALVDFVTGLPDAYKLDGSYKPLLNRAVRDVVPDRIRSRRKHGFSVPIGRWFREDHEAIDRWMTEDRLAAAPYLDADDVLALHAAHRRGRADHHGALWKALNYVAWYHVHAEP